MATVQWRGMKPDELGKLMAAKMARKLEACAILVQNEMKAGLSAGDVTAHPPAGASAASAGGYPYKRTGRLAGSITRNVDTEALTANVGTPVTYGAWLQTGTRKMAARPWITLAWNACVEKIKEILGSKTGGPASAPPAGHQTNTGRRGGVYHMSNTGRRVYHKRESGG